MPVKPVDFRTKALELAESNGWRVSESPTHVVRYRYVFQRNGVVMVVAFSGMNNFMYAHTSEDTINRYVVLEQILTAPEDSVTVVKKPGELTGFTIRHETPSPTEEVMLGDQGITWPTMITAADRITAQRYSAETTEWYTVGSAHAFEMITSGRHWVVMDTSGRSIAQVGGIRPNPSDMTERDMRRAVVAILREMC